MIIWTFYGILTWIIIRLSLLVFYSILAAYIFETHKTIFHNTLKNLIYGIAFASMVAGIWELPLFIFGAEHGLQWVLNDVLYTFPFLIFCILFHIHFSLGKKELALFGTWCIIASGFAELGFLTLNKWGSEWAFYWNQDISYVFRITTFIFLYLIFRRIKR